MKKSLLVLFVLTTTIAQAQLQQRSTTKGLNAAISAHVLGWTSEYFQYLDENASSGFGGGLRVGYGITELFEPYVGFDITSLGTSKVDAESFKMSHIDFGLRLNLAGTVSQLRPFVEGGYTARKGVIKQVINGDQHDDVEFTGGTPHVGGGLHYFPKRAISIFARGVFTVGKKSDIVFNSAKTDDQADVTTFRVSIGASFNISELIKE